MFSGSIVAIVTPMLDSGEVDFDSFVRLVDWHLENKTDGLVVLGTTGESPTVEPAEREALVRQAVKRVAGRIPVIVGTGGNSTHATICLTRQALELGADAALLVTPYYNKPTQEGLYRHFKAVAEAVAIPQILYNVPSRTGCDLLPETVQRLAKINNIVALKEATGKIDRAHELINLKLELDLLSGDDGSAMEFILAGGRGVISVAANVLPSKMHQLGQAALSADRAAAQEINDNLQPIYKMLCVESNPIPTKWVLSQMGMTASGIRLPLTPLAEQYHQGVRDVMQLAGITFN